MAPRSDGALTDGHVRGWLLWMLAVTALFLAPTTDAVDAVAFVAAHTSMVAALVVGVRRHRPAGRSTWWFIITGQIVYVVANLVWYVGPVLLDWKLGFPSVADALYLVAYASLAIGLWQLALARSRERSRTVVLEIATVTIGIGALLWLYLGAPIASDVDTPILVRLVALAYPVFDLALVSIVAALLLLPGRRPTSFWLLTAGLGAAAAADGIYAYTSLEGSFSYGQPYFALWLVFYALFGAAALHPSMGVLADPSEEAIEDRPWWRTWVLPIALVVPLFAVGMSLLADGHTEQLPVPLAVAVAIVLVALRQDRLLSDLVTKQRREAELAASEAAAQESTRVKSAFLATMSHEIRTPMNAVIGMSELLADTDLDEEQERYATGIHTAGEALLTIINDILDFSKIEAGELRLEEVDFDLERQLEGVAELFTPSAGSRGIDLYSYLHPGTPRLVRGDAGRVRQVLTNLVSNAVKFTEQGRVILRAASVPADDGSVRFEVSDTGTGIDPAVQAQLFEPFSQADASSSRRYGGTGLGLAICRQLVELMGGEIGVDSRPGHGSTFWFTIPLRTTEARAEDRSVEPLRHTRVLVVDDDATNREIVERQTSAWGMRPGAASGADEALGMLADAQAQGDPYLVVLLDLQMPGVDGLELARRIRHEASGDALMVMLSSSDPDLAAVRTSGIAAQLRKPVRQSQLYDVLISLLLPGRTAPEVDATADLRPHHGTVLLVEDNAANQLVGSRIVEKLGYDVDVATNGREALDAVELRGYDAILMDCQMPVMDGFEATRRLRERERGRTRHVPILAMTASVTVEDRQRCIEAGMDDFIAKPVRPDAVAAALHRWTSAPAPPDEPSSSGEPATDSASVVDEDRWQVLISLMRGEPTLLDELVDRFVREAPDRVEALRRTTADADPSALERAAHNLKGSAANLGAQRLAAVAAQVEDLAAAEDLAGVDQLIDAAHEELEAVLEALEHRVP